MRSVATTPQIDALERERDKLKAMLKTILGDSFQYDGFETTQVPAHVMEAIGKLLEKYP